MNKIKILIASDSFKGSASSKTVNAAIARGIKKAGIPVKVEEISIADGGEGTIEAIIERTKGEIKKIELNSALGKNKTIHYGLMEDKETAVLETAETLGLTRIDKEQLDPSSIDSGSLGDLIRYLLDEGIRKFYIGLGGSATNDCGYGMLRSLGAKFLDEEGKEISGNIKELENLARIDLDSLDPRIEESSFILLADVSNPLCGKKGATYTYGPQKGVKEEDLEFFDMIICKIGEKMEEALNRQFLEESSAGAAGGLGAAFIGPLQATVENGIEKILELISFNEYLMNSDLVITGEGRMDHQSIYGKAPMGVLKAGKKQGLPVIAVVGSIGEGIEAVYEEGMDLVLCSISSPISLEEAIEKVEENLERTGYQLIKAFTIK